MQSREPLNDGRENDYALGLFLSRYCRLPIVEHAGANFGYRTDLLRFPEQRFTVITLCNASNADPSRLARGVADIYLEKELQPFPATSAVFGSAPSELAGKYFDRHTHFLVSFEVEHGNLLLEDHPLYPVGPGRLEDPVTGGTVIFSDSKGVKKATVSYNHAITFEGSQFAGDFHPDGAALAAYVGVYKSAELNATYQISLEDGTLVLKLNWDPPIKLTPLVQNEFSADGLTLVFHRDNGNRVIGLSVFGGWDALIRNENFEKIN